MAEQQIGVEGQVGHQMGEQLPSASEIGASGGGPGDINRVMNSDICAHIAFLRMFFG